jgi:hypothetical protein
MPRVRCNIRNHSFRETCYLVPVIVNGVGRVNRREFVTIIGGAAVVGPCPAPAQATKRTIANEFVRIKVDVIVTHTMPPVLAAKQVTSSVPIVFATAGDPVGTGIVASLARPGGNITGLSSQHTDTVGKRLELLREVSPRLHRLAIMLNAGSSYAVLEKEEVQKAARALGLEFTAYEIGRAEDFATIFDKLNSHVDGNLCRSRPLHKRQPYSDHYVSHGCSSADDPRFSRVRRGWWSHVLWPKLD